MTSQEDDKQALERWRKLSTISWSLIGIFIVLGILSFFLYRLRVVIAPFVYAIAIVYLLQPAVDYLERKGMSRLSAVVFVYLGLFLVIIILAVFIIPVVIRESQVLIKALPDYVNSGKLLFSRYLTVFRAVRVPKEADAIVSQVLEGIKQSLSFVLLRISKSTYSLFGSFFNLLLAPIIAFYLLKDLKAVNNGVMRIITPSYHKDAQLIFRKIDSVLAGIVRGQLADAALVGILSSIGLLILNIDFAVIIGMTAGFFNLIPYFGPIIGAIPALIIALVKFSAWKALAVIVMFMIVQQLDSLLIYPYVMRKQVGLHPLAVILGLLAGGTLMGLMGMLIAIPVLAIGKAVVEYILDKRDLRYEEQ